MVLHSQHPLQTAGQTPSHRDAHLLGRALQLMQRFDQALAFRIVEPRRVRRRHQQRTVLIRCGDRKIVEPWQARRVRRVAQFAQVLLIVDRGAADEIHRRGPEEIRTGERIDEGVPPLHHAVHHQERPDALRACRAEHRDVPRREDIRHADQVEIVLRHRIHGVRRIADHLETYFLQAIRHHGKVACTDPRFDHHHPGHPPTAEQTNHLNPCITKWSRGLPQPIFPLVRAENHRPHTEPERILLRHHRQPVQPLALRSGVVIHHAHHLDRRRLQRRTDAAREVPRAVQRHRRKILLRTVPERAPHPLHPQRRITHATIGAGRAVEALQRALQNLIQGARVFDRSDPQQRCERFIHLAGPGTQRPQPCDALSRNTFRTAPLLNAFPRGITRRHPFRRLHPHPSLKRAGEGIIIPHREHRPARPIGSAAPRGQSQHLRHAPMIRSDDRQAAAHRLDAGIREVLPSRWDHRNRRAGPLRCQRLRPHHPEELCPLSQMWIQQALQPHAAGSAPRRGVRIRPHQMQQPRTLTRRHPVPGTDQRLHALALLQATDIQQRGRAICMHTRGLFNFRAVRDHLRALAHREPSASPVRHERPRRAHPVRQREAPALRIDQLTHPAWQRLPAVAVQFRVQLGW